MQGYGLAMITGDFSPVAPDHDEDPVVTVDLEKALNPRYRDILEENFGTRDFREAIHNLPAHVLLRLGTQGCAKALISTRFALDREVKNELDEDVTLALVTKVKSSLWRWGLNAAKWNDIVGAVNGIARFTLGREDFTMRLDWSRNVSPKGYSENSGTWLDGVFGFLVHWKGQHVMTIGFSFVGDRKILLQQVQATSSTGNRWMFKLPANRLEHVITCFRKAFEGYDIYVADGKDYTAQSMKDYGEALEIRKSRNDNEEDEDIARLEGKIATLTRDRTRIAAFYRDAGNYSLGEVLKINDLKHYKVEV